MPFLCGALRVHADPGTCSALLLQKILQNLEQETGCHVLLAQKAFSMFSLYPLIGQYISGTTASGIFEARLGKEEMGKENHVFAPAYKEKDMEELVQICDHVIFNSFAQYENVILRFPPAVDPEIHF